MQYPKATANRAPTFAALGAQLKTIVLRFDNHIVVEQLDLHRAIRRPAHRPDFP